MICIQDMGNGDGVYVFSRASNIPFLSGEREGMVTENTEKYRGW